ncbi:MAG: hypothetical protein RL154_436 [Pseudomonadota bacterium]|jgi:mercuric ion binding protein
MKFLITILMFCIFVFADTNATIEVVGMHCPLCTTSVKKAIRSIDGIKEVSARLDTKQVIVIYDDKVDIKTVLDAIKTTSYEGKVLSIKGTR